MKNLSYYLDTCPTHIKDDFIYDYFNTSSKILIQNNLPEFVYIIEKGSAKVFSLTKTGTAYLEHIYGEYELFGELEVFLNKPVLNYVEALKPCYVIKIPRDTFFRWIKYDSSFSIYLNTLISEKMYNHSIQNKINIVHPLKYRVLFFIWKCLNNNIKLLNKDIIVEGLGSNIRSINRIIKELSDDNILIYDKGLIKINDFNKFMNIIDNYL